MKEKYGEIKIKKELFSEKADTLIEDLSTRIESGKQEILSYATKTGSLI
ncbi:hypothetical protein JCM19274_565 [Algibacter lectus]|uniref:Uncharacterized protein n=1 Tax=Algibacter lectus TaxID=221126 RepID=A0A090WT14_9FLAO|nr:hypothetical protein JCM19274_565 [Algibacter lectus]